MANVAVLGIDIAKNVFQLHGVDADGQVVLRRRVMRDQLLQVTEAMPPCLIGIEACTGAFHWQRHFEAQGHTVKMIAPQYVKPFLKGQKNDGNDAQAICNCRSTATYALRAEEIHHPAGHPGPPPCSAEVGQSPCRPNLPNAGLASRARCSDRKVRLDRPATDTGDHQQSKDRYHRVDA